MEFLSPILYGFLSFAYLFVYKIVLIADFLAHLLLRLLY